MQVKSAKSQKVVVRNRYAYAEYPSMESAARALSSIGTMGSKEVLSLLRDRVGYINGFSVSYPDGGDND